MSTDTYTGTHRMTAEELAVYAQQVYVRAHAAHLETEKLVDAIVAQGGEDLQALRKFEATKQQFEQQNEQNGVSETDARELDIATRTLEGRLTALEQRAEACEKAIGIRFDDAGNLTMLEGGTLAKTLRHDETLYGSEQTGEPGLVKRVERLEKGKPSRFRNTFRRSFKRRQNKRPDRHATPSTPASRRSTNTAKGSLLAVLFVALIVCAAGWLGWLFTTWLIGIGVAVPFGPWGAALTTAFLAALIIWATSRSS